MIRTTALLAAALMVVGCDERAGPADGSVGLDSGTTPDGSTPTDAGGGVDASGADSDGDGVPDSVDCQPSNASVGSTDTRACTTECGDGTETCTDGVYTACSAGTDCACDTAGERRVVECGLCGMRSEECMSGTWTSISECLGQGECTFGDVDDRMTLRCGHDQRLCDAACHWSEWTVLMPEGDCEAGMRGGCISPLDDYLCTADCRVVDDPDCDPPTIPP